MYQTSSEIQYNNNQPPSYTRTTSSSSLNTSAPPSTTTTVNNSGSNLAGEHIQFASPISNPSTPASIVSYNNPNSNQAAYTNIGDQQQQQQLNGGQQQNMLQQQLTFLKGSFNSQHQPLTPQSQVQSIYSNNSVSQPSTPSPSTPKQLNSSSDSQSSSNPVALQAPANQQHTTRSPISKSATSNSLADLSNDLNGSYEAKASHSNKEANDDESTEITLNSSKTKLELDKLKSDENGDDDEDDDDDEEEEEEVADVQKKKVEAELDDPILDLNPNLISDLIATIDSNSLETLFKETNDVLDKVDNLLANESDDNYEKLNLFDLNITYSILNKDEFATYLNPNESAESAKPKETDSSASISKIESHLMQSISYSTVEQTANEDSENIENILESL